ncbi:TPA: hypothetical protein DEX28_02945 [Patescibacteria group bacterium]|nr:hypothetical protein [Patescibacteria group bacterium]
MSQKGKIKQSCRKSSAGFTLIELMITLAIMVTLSSVSFFYYANSYRQNLLTTASSEIVFLTRLAQQESISQKENRSWGVRFDNSDSNVPFLAVFSGSYVQANVRERYYLPSQLGFQSPAAGTSTEIIFSKLKGIPNASSTVIFGLKNSASQKNLVVNASGGISVD